MSDAIVIVGAGACGTRAALALRQIWFGLAEGGRLVAAAAGPGNCVARDIKLAETLIARRAIPEPAMLADPGVALKSVLRSPVAG
jgi:hypothetical protein